MTTCPTPFSSFTPVIVHDNPTLSWVGYDRGIKDIFAVHYLDNHRTLQCLDTFGVRQTPLPHKSGISVDRWLDECLSHKGLIQKPLRKPDHILKRRRKNKAARKARKKT